MDHIYVLQSTHTQSYQPVQKYRLKHNISNIYNQLCDRTPQNEFNSGWTI